jgi:hypothetical protein
MVRLSQRVWSRPRGQLRAAGARVPNEPGGKVHGRKPRAFAATWWIRARSCIYLLSWDQVAREEDVGTALKRLQDTGLIPEDGYAFIV